MISRLDEATSDISTLVGYIEESELQYLKVYGNKFWVDEMLDVVDKIEEVRELLNDLRTQL